MNRKFIFLASVMGLLIAACEPATQETTPPAGTTPAPGAPPAGTTPGTGAPPAGTATTPATPAKTPATP